MAEEKKNVSNDEDDFTFGELKTGKTDDNADDKGDDNGDDKGDDNADDKSDDKADDKGDDDKKGDDKKDDKKDKKSDDKSDDKTDDDEDDDVDIFLDKNDKGYDDTKKISLKKLAKDLDVDLEKDDDEEEFKTKFSEKLEKNKAEFKLDGYSDDAKAVIKHLNENGGDIDSFFVNKQIASMQNVLALDPETKFRNVRIQEVMAEGKSKADAITAVDAEIKDMSTREIKDFADDIDTQAKKLINDEVKKIVGDKEIKAAAERSRKATEEENNRKNLKTFIDKQDNFLGLGLTPEAKKLILKDIDNGNFDKVLSQKPEEIKFASYMFSKYGSKIIKKIESTLSESNRKGYNAATRKSLDALHKTGDGKQSRKTGHEPDKSKSENGNKPGWNKDDFE